MKMILCATCASMMKAKNPENHKKDKCQCCGGWRWCTRYDVDAGGKREV